MAGMPYLIDSNILIRWVQPSDPDYPIVESALEGLAHQGAILCYTSQNVAEFWNAVLGQPTKMDMDFHRRRPTGAHGYLSRGFACSRTTWQFIKNGAVSS